MLSDIGLMSFKVSCSSGSVRGGFFSSHVLPRRKKQCILIVCYLIEPLSCSIFELLKLSANNDLKTAAAWKMRWRREGGGKEASANQSAVIVTMPLEILFDFILTAAKTLSIIVFILSVGVYQNLAKHSVQNERKNIYSHLSNFKSFIYFRISWFRNFSKMLFMFVYSNC